MNTASALELPLPELRLRSNRYRAFTTFPRRKPLGFASGVLILVLLIVAIAGPFLTADPLAFHVTQRYESPNAGAWFGRDDKGRDVFARTVEGTRISLEVGFMAALIGTSFGMIFGLVIGYSRGWLEIAGLRIVDSFLAFPALLLAMAVTVALGRSVTIVSIALAMVAWPSAARVVRAAVLIHASSQYVEAARSQGVQTARILFRHILPNVISVYIVLVSAALAQAILSEASLSFLGVGVQPPTPSLGGMVLDAQRYMVKAPWMAIFPGIGISLAVIGFNLFGDALRDLLDPRLQKAA